MNAVQLPKQICAVLFLIIFANSCNGQDRIQDKFKANHTTNSVQQKKLHKTQGTDQYQGVCCSFRDKAGNLWFGTSGEGVYKYDGKFFSNFTEKDGLNSNSVSCILEDKSGNIWFATKQAICRYDGKIFTNISIPGVNGSNFLSYSPISNNAPTGNELCSMLLDKSGKFWLGTTDGIYCFDGKSFTRFLDNKNIENKDNVTLKLIQCMSEDRSGNIWFGSRVFADEGICRYNGTSIKQFKPFGEGWIRSITEDKAGHLLFVTRHNGVLRYDGKTFTHFTEKGGPDNMCITSLLEDQAGNLWLGTEMGSGQLGEPGGLWRFDGKNFARYTTKDGLCHNGIFSIVEDNKHNIWLGTRNTQLCRYDGKTFVDFSE